MASIKKSTPDFEALIDHQEADLLSLQTYVDSFLDTKHKPKDTEKVQGLVCKANLEINATLEKILKSKATASSQFKKESDKLCQRLRDLKQTYIRDMKDDLTEDLYKLHRAKKDLVKDTTFFFGLPASFFVVVKNGLINCDLKPEEAARIAAGIGFVISTGVLAHNKIKGASKTARDFITPHQIKNNCFMIFYVVESAREKQLAVKNVFRGEAQSITKRVLGMADKAKRAVAKISIYKRPEL
jgi:hypothetical protein